ncbi:MAG: hypothetical protein ACR2NP_22230 [Pirellulaceae bacterium]
MTRLSFIVLVAICTFLLTSNDLRAQYFNNFGGNNYGGTGGYYGGTPNYYGGNTGYYGGQGAGYGGYGGGYGQGYGNAIIIRVRVGGQVVNTVPTVQTYYPGVNNAYPGYGNVPGYWGNNQQRRTVGSADLRNVNSDVFVPGQIRPTTPLLRNQTQFRRSAANTTQQQTRPSYRYRY